MKEEVMKIKKEAQEQQKKQDEDQLHQKVFQLMNLMCYMKRLQYHANLEEHVKDMERFNHAVFLPDDFMEPVDFDRFEVELF